MTIKFFYFTFICIYAVLAQMPPPPPNDLNYVNPDFNYQESILVNTHTGQLPYAGEMYTGYIQVNQTDGSRIFYSLFSAGGQFNSSSTVNISAPLVLWINGGPGCTGESVWDLLGPFDFDMNSDNETYATNDGLTWANKYHLLLVDNPIGIGFSVTGGFIPRDSMTTAVHLQTFLTRFFELYPSLAEQDFYLAGSSYSGHFIPALATLLIQNYATVNIRISGIMIGDGWTDPINQVVGYGPTALSSGTVDLHTVNYTQQISDWMIQNITQGNYINPLILFNELLNFYGTVAQVNIYNFQNDTMTPDYSSNWLNNNTNKILIGVDPSVNYEFCDASTPYNFALDFFQSYASNVSFLLTQNVMEFNILIYQGQFDFIVPTSGVEHYLKKLNWTGVPYFFASKKKFLYDTQGEIVGSYQEHKNLAYAFVYGAGHRIESDQPWVLHHLLDLFVEKKDWRTS